MCILRYIWVRCSLSLWLQGKAHDGIPAGVIDVVWHSSLQGKDAKGWDPKEQHEGGWNATFAFLVSVSSYMTRKGREPDICI